MKLRNFGLEWRPCTDATTSRQLSYRVQVHTWTNSRVKVMSRKHPCSTLSQTRQQNNEAVNRKYFRFLFEGKECPIFKCKTLSVGSRVQFEEVMKIVYKFKLATTEENFLKELQTDEESII